MKKKEKTAISVKNLIKLYGELKAVDDISFDVHDGEIFGIVGPNGAGKTTIVECLVGLRVPSRGEIKILDLDSKKDDYKIRQLIGIQLQEGKFPDKIKIKEVLELFASLYSNSSPLPFNNLLERVGLEEKANVYYGSLSGGQKQRLSIALALINDPQIIFLDELTTGLDPQARRATWEMIRAIRKTGKTIVLVTHFMDEAEQLCDRVAVIDHGKLIALDTPTNLIGSLGDGWRIKLSTLDQKTLTQLKGVNGCQFNVTDSGVDIQCRDGRVIGEIMHILDKNNCNFQGFSVSKSTLEDVFLSLTGREMRE